MTNKAILSDSEWHIMQELWQTGGATLRELTGTVGARMGWSKHTIISFLKRMEQKGAVRAEGERPKLFLPLLERESAQAEETADFLGRVYGGDALLLVTNAVEKSNLTESDIEKLIAILKEGRGDD